LGNGSFIHGQSFYSFADPDFVLVTSGRANNPSLHFRNIFVGGRSEFDQPNGIRFGLRFDLHFEGSHQPQLFTHGFCGGRRIQKLQDVENLSHDQASRS